MTAGVAARTLGQRVTAAFQSKEAADASRRRTLATNAEKMASTMGHLKGAAMKVGQMLSADPDFLPEEMNDALSTLQQNAPPMPFEVVKEVVEAALSAPLDQLFESFSTEPIGAASIGQVHRAMTRDGQDVAVKVQYPGIADSIESDMKNMASLLNLARAKVPKERIDAYVDEVTETLKKESDYLNEADNLERFQVVLKDLPELRAPTPVFELSRRNVLTMEFIEGPRLTDWLITASETQKTQKGEALIKAYITMMHEHGVLHADPHPGNFLVDNEERVVFLDLGCVRDFETSFAEGLAGILIGVWRSDLDRVMRELAALDFQTEGVDPELIWEWLELILEPLITPGLFDFGAWPIHENSRAFVLKNPSILSFAPPRQALFYVRVLAGLRGLLGKASVRMDAHAISKAAIQSLGYR